MTEAEFEALKQAYFDRRAALLELPPEERSAHEAAYLEFMTNKPNPPEHAEYMRRAGDLYPDLPPGAQQNALHCLETLGKVFARRYAANARARQASNERALMGTTLSAWRVKRSGDVKPYLFEGVCTWSPKRRREHAEFLNRYNNYMAAGKARAAKAHARASKTAERRLAAELAAVGVKPVVSPAPRANVDYTLVAELIALLKSETGVSYTEAAQVLQIKPKGDRPHQTPAAQVRALVRDRVRPTYEIVGVAHDRDRGGAVYRLKNARCQSHHAPSSSH